MDVHPPATAGGAPAAAAAASAPTTAESARKRRRSRGRKGRGGGAAVAGAETATPSEGDADAVAAPAPALAAAPLPAPAPTPKPAAPTAKKAKQQQAPPVAIAPAAVAAPPAPSAAALPAAPARGPRGGNAKQPSAGSPLTRLDCGPRLSEAVIHAGVVYLAGQVAEATAGRDAGAQTREVLGLVDALLARAGSSKARILRAQILLSDIRDYDAMNAAWDAWVAPGSAPARVTAQALLARPEWRVEIVVTAAV